MKINHEITSWSSSLVLQNFKCGREKVNLQIHFYLQLWTLFFRHVQGSKHWLQLKSFQCHVLTLETFSVASEATTRLLACRRVAREISSGKSVSSRRFICWTKKTTTMMMKLIIINIIDIIIVSIKLVMLLSDSQALNCTIKNKST